jgi:hypothetical protein
MTLRDIPSLINMLASIALFLKSIDIHPNYIQLEQVNAPVQFMTFKRLCLSLLGNYVLTLTVD